MMTDPIRWHMLRIRRAVFALLGLATTSYLVAACSSVDQQNSWVYSCPDGYRFEVRYSGGGESAELRVPAAPGAAEDSPGQSLRLTREITASGARYSDGTTALWTKGIMAMIEVDSIIVHRDCQGDSDRLSSVE